MSRIPLTFLPSILRNIGVAWRLLNNPSVPRWLKFLLPLAAMVYHLWPIDLLPGIPVDDFFVWLFLLPQLLIWLSPAEAVAEARYGVQIPQKRADDDDDQVIDVPWQSVS